MVPNDPDLGKTISLWPNTPWWELTMGSSGMTILYIDLYWLFSPLTRGHRGQLSRALLPYLLWFWNQYVNIQSKASQGRRLIPMRSYYSPWGLCGQWTRPGLTRLPCLSSSSLPFQYDFVELLDGSRLLSKEKRSLSDAEAGRGHAPSTREGDGLRAARRARSVNVHEAGFIQFMDTGIWHLAFYNDGRNGEQVSYNTIVIGTFVESEMDGGQDGLFNPRQDCRVCLL